jgi:hypothetical protein
MADDQKTSQKDSVRPNLAIVAITVLVSVGAAFITSQATTRSTVKDIVRPIHLESGQFEVTPSDTAESHLSQPPPKVAQANFRFFNKHVNFDKPFDFIPVVRTGISGLDCANQANLRVATYALQVNEKGFDLKVQTWSDSIVHSVELNWVAYQQ